MLRAPTFSRSIAVLLCLAGVAAQPMAAGTADHGLARLLAAYPDQLAAIEGNTLVWRDGTRMELDDGKGPKSFEAWLEDPDIEDMLAIPYPAGDLTAPPQKNIDPGRGRNAHFFDKMYGDCRKGEVAKNLVEIAWLPGKTHQRLKVTKVNGVDKRLTAISRELGLLPAKFDPFLIPAAGATNCRVIAGTDRPSAHGYGIALDIALKHAHYWRWPKTGPSKALAYKNEIPMEIVRIFEQHGFIWGGKWYHYDTMHFEYRPELIAPAP